MRTVIAIRAHQWTERESQLYEQLQAYFGHKNVFVVMDETKACTIMPKHIAKILMNDVALNNLNLFIPSHHRGVGWLCGDYFYYVLHQAVQADFYWLIEPDVGHSFDDWASFFGHFSQTSADALLYNYAPAPKSWYWKSVIEPFFAKPYQCFFPLTRLSNKAISLALQDRQAMKAYFDHNQDKPYPNDESLLASSLHQHRLTVEHFVDHLPDAFWFFSFNRFVAPNALLAQCPPNQIVHPVRLPKFDHEPVIDVLKKQLIAMQKKGHLLHQSDLLCMLDELADGLIQAQAKIGEPIQEQQTDASIQIESYLARLPKKLSKQIIKSQRPHRRKKPPKGFAKA